MYTDYEEWVFPSFEEFMQPFWWAQNWTATKKRCVLMFTKPMEEGTCILGMPFMRNYYTLFDRETKTISTALHDGNCNMDAPQAGLQLRQKVQTKQSLRRIDVS